MWKNVAYCSKKTSIVKKRSIFMSITSSLLYLLLLYAVLDKDGKLSLTTGLVLAFIILLLKCHFNRRCCNGRSNCSSISDDNVFFTLNGF